MTSVIQSGVAIESEFDGVPLADLIFESIDWNERREHVETRAERKGTDEFEPKVEWATEACQDGRRLVGRTTSAVYVIGFSQSCGRLLRVVLQPCGHASEGDWIGLTAHAAPAWARKRYEEEQ
jgi:hypothetical protein